MNARAQLVLACVLALACLALAALFSCTDFPKPYLGAQPASGDLFFQDKLANNISDISESLREIMKRTVSGKL